MSAQAATCMPSTPPKQRTAPSAWLPRALRGKLAPRAFLSRRPRSKHAKHGHDHTTFRAWPLLL